MTFSRNDTIHALPQALAPAEYVRKQVAIQAQVAGLVARLPRGAVLAQYVRSVLIFMTTPADGHAARTANHTAGGAGGAEPPNEPPPEPLVAFDQLMQSYRWIGPPALSTNAGTLARARPHHAPSPRPLPPRPLPPRALPPRPLPPRHRRCHELTALRRARLRECVAALQRLELRHYELFLAQHGGVVGLAGQRGLHAAPSSHKSVLTLPPGSAEQLVKFREEEQTRFERTPPDAIFTYTLRDGSRASVAPLGKKPGGKARDHFLLMNERPAAVTILSLVRDAAARLPGGEGSRTDVCELLKESAFVLPGVNDAQISTVASGALDRLQSEVDACVRYDAERKLWIYLHAKRTAADFAAAKLAASRPTA